MIQWFVSHSFAHCASQNTHWKHKLFLHENTCYSRMAVCILTCTTCKKHAHFVLQNGRYPKTSIPDQNPTTSTSIFESRSGLVTEKVSGSPSYFASILASLTDLKNSNSTLWQFILKFGSKFEPAGHVTIIPKAFSRILTAKSMAELYLQHFCSGRTSKGRLQVCRSRWLPHACLKKKYYHSCYTDLAQESKVLMLPKFWAETANFFPWEIISFLL